MNFGADAIQPITGGGGNLPILLGYCMLGLSKFPWIRERALDE